MEKNGPLFPGEIEGALQLFHIGHYTEAGLGAKVIEGIRRCNFGLRLPMLFA